MSPVGDRPLAGRAENLALAAGGALALASGAGFVLQHRAVTRGRAAAAAVDRRRAGLSLPHDVVHHRVDTDDGGIVHVVERGAGRPIVLVHGIELAADIWSQQLAVLGDHHRVVAVDLRGHGQSIPGSDGFRGGVARLAQDVARVIEALGLEGALLVGHSLGGMTAMRLVVDAEPAWLAQRLVALALVDTSGGPLVGRRGARLAHRPVSAALSRTLLLAERLGMAGRSTDLGWWGARAAFGPDPDPAHVALTDALATGTAFATLAGLIGPLGSFDIAEEVRAIRLPTLVVVGSHDRLTPTAHARRLAEAIPGAELAELARCGHMPMLERPRELARLLQDLLERATVGA